MSELIHIKEQNYCFLGIGSRLEGRFFFEGTIRLACHLSGELHMKTDRTLTIETQGKVVGDINCHDLEVFGEMEGNIKANGKVQIFPSGKVTGQLSAQNLVIHPGAIVNLDAQTSESQ